jgi:hypothetical protein
LAGFLCQKRVLILRVCEPSRRVESVGLSGGRGWTGIDVVVVVDVVEVDVVEVDEVEVVRLVVVVRVVVVDTIVVVGGGPVAVVR